LGKDTESSAGGGIARGDPDLRRYLPPPLAGATGRGVVVAVLDSGVNAGHPHVGAVERGVSVSMGEGRAIVFGKDYSDLTGHGTACAAVIRGWAPDCRLIAVRVLDDRLLSDTSLVAAGLEWAVSRGADVVNMSLGTYGEETLGKLEELCRKAAGSAVVLVASATDGDVIPAPARFSSVISVAPCFEAREVTLEGGDRPGVDFKAYPYPRGIPGLSREMNFKGPSFASAHVSGIACLVKEIRPRAGSSEAREMIENLMRGIGGGR